MCTNSGSVKKKRHRLYKLDSKPLHTQWPFWYALIGPFLVAMVIFLNTYSGQEHLWQVSGQEQILNDSKLALFILALSPIFTSIVTNFHRTIQTNTQILASDKKNVVDAYITHHKLCNENLSHLQDRLNLNLLPIKNAKLLESLSGEEKNGMEDSEYNKHFHKLTIEFYHKKLNLLYAEFFPVNSLEKGVSTYVPKDILPEILNLLESKLSEILADEFYARLSIMIDAWDLKGHKYSPVFFSREMESFFGQLNAHSFRSFNFYSNSPPGIILTEFVYMAESLTSKYFTEVSLCLNGEVLRESIYEALLEDTYKVSFHNVSAYVTKAIFHVLEISVAMGARNNSDSVTKRLHVMNRLISNLDYYLSR